MSDAMKLTKNCIHCGSCTKKCSFLAKYELDLAAFSNRSDLAYHCFLCGDCAAVCPKKIDGRAIALALRKEHTNRYSPIPDTPDREWLRASPRSRSFRRC